MPTIQLQAPFFDSVRVQKTAQNFDCDPEIYLKREINYEIPPLDSNWKIGLIVGPSGAGKTTVAKEILGTNLFTGYDWATDRAMIDNFPPDMTTQQINFLLTAVGFSSIPAWIKPYQVLSNGEKFRADLALALSQGKDNDIVAFDEYTSVVDRTVAKTASMALNKNIKLGRINRRFVAVTCHYDLIEWLQPDWILDMESGVCSGGCQRRRPEIHVEIRKTGKKFWELFERHHYLRGKLSAVNDYWCGFIDDKPACFAIVVWLMQHRRFSQARRISRLVVMPEFQGIGIGTKFISAVAAHYRRQLYDVYANMRHAALVSALSRSPDWIFLHENRAGRTVGYLCDDGTRSRSVDNRKTYTFRFRRGAEKNYP